MSVFQNMRTRCLSKSWPSFFVRSGKFASAFVDLRTAVTGSLPGDAGLIERHGSTDSVGKALRHELISLGLMQDGPGAPKGNANARAENRAKVAIQSRVDPLAKPQKSGLIQKKFAAVPPSKVKTLTTTTKLVDGKLSTSVAGLKRIDAAAHDALKRGDKVFAHTVPTSDGPVVNGVVIIGRSNTKECLEPAKTPTHHPVVPAKRSHHKKTTSNAEILAAIEKPSVAAKIAQAVVPAKRSHHKKKVA